MFEGPLGWWGWYFFLTHLFVLSALFLLVLRRRDRPQHGRDEGGDKHHITALVPDESSGVAVVSDGSMSGGERKVAGD